MEVIGQLHASAALCPVTHWIGRGSWVGPRADPDAVAKRKIPVPSPAGNRTLVVQSIVPVLTELPGSSVE